MKLRHKIDYSGLEAYLKSLDRSEIETTWNKPKLPKLSETYLIDDIEKFNDDYALITSYGEPFLVDALGGDLSVCILTRRKYRLPTGRVVQMKFVKTIIEDCHAVYGTALNGCWKIPSRFVEPLKKISNGKP